MLAAGGACAVSRALSLGLELCGGSGTSREGGGDTSRQGGGRRGRKVQVDESADAAAPELAADIEALALRPAQSKSVYTLKDGDQASKSEELVRKKFEVLTGYKFPTVYPSWLKNPKPSGHTLLELDGFCEELGIAFEFQGPLHYAYDAEQHASYTKFEASRQKDALKVKLCAQRGVALVVVPYTVKPEIMTFYVGSRLFDIVNAPPAQQLSHVQYDKLRAIPSIRTGAAKPALYIEPIPEPRPASEPAP